MADWRFGRKRKGEKTRNPIQGEFFSDEAVERPAQALVREVIQNSLDARAGDGPVRVRFAVSTNLAPARAKHWFGGVWPHLRAPESGLRDIPAAPGPGRFLVVEDFGTTGLDGDPMELEPETPPSRLFAFFRAEGVSQKGGQQGGRWGVGKTVFQRSSGINALLAVTVRSHGSALTFGQCVLRHHHLGAQAYTPDGWFGRVVPVDGEEVVVPTEDDAVRRKLCADFGIQRTKEPGLSVVVPYAYDELTGAAIADAVAREYFYPILLGRLSVTVDDPELPGGSRTLEESTLVETMAKAPGIKGDLGPLAAFTSEIARTGLASAVDLDPPPAGKPEWCDAQLPTERRLALSARFRAGETVLVKVPMTVHPEKSPVATFFHVALRRDLQDRGAVPLFVRNGIQIPKALERRIRGASVWALVIIEDAPLAALLGDAETPAHTHWSKDTQNFRGRYLYGGPTLDFVRAAPRQLTERLSEVAKGRDLVSLATLFPVPREGTARVAPKSVAARTAAGVAPPEAFPVPASSTAGVALEKIGGGFRVKGATPTTPFSVVFAYDCSGGDPLRRFDRRDFDLSTLDLRAKGARVEPRYANEFLVTPTGGALSIEVRGFDDHRDLYVRVALLDGAAEGPT